MNRTTFSLLIVDDDEDDRLIIDDAFEEIGYEAQVKKFINGKMLLAYLKQIERSQYPSLIVLDNTLPELDAEDILVILKSNKDYEAIPVVVYTTSLSPGKKETLLQKGVYRCYEKADVMEKVVQIAKELKQLADSNNTTV
ncbi:MAG TPA: response regulator [Flavisolibacter sp.]|nr:response regulator [Flavisolibacter sp.]